MKSQIKVTNLAQAAVIEIEGVIGVPEKMQFERPEQKVATYEAFSRSLEEIAELDASEVVVNIRSTGGDVNDALLIYEALSGLDGEVTTRCMGYVASAATIIAQAASPGKREISPNALYLIHCSESAAEGNAQCMSSTKEMLEATDRRIAEIYAARSGRSAGEFETLMRENGGRGRWLSADEAIAAGLVDAVMKAEKVVNDASVYAEEWAELSETFEMLGLPPIPGFAQSALESASGGEDDHDEIDKNSGREGNSGGFLRRLSDALKSLAAIFGSPAGEQPQKNEDVAQAEKISAEPAAPDETDGLDLLDTIESAISEHNNEQTEPKKWVRNMPQDKSVIIEQPDRQASSMPTLTGQKEDPSISGDYRRTANELAYEDDIRSIKSF